MLRCMFGVFPPIITLVQFRAGFAQTARHRDARVGQEDLGEVPVVGHILDGTTSWRSLSMGTSRQVMSSCLLVVSKSVRTSRMIHWP